MANIVAPAPRYQGFTNDQINVSNKALLQNEKKPNFDILANSKNIKEFEQNYIKAINIINCLLYTSDAADES